MCVRACVRVCLSSEEGATGGSWAHHSSSNEGTLDLLPETSVNCHAQGLDNFSLSLKFVLSQIFLFYQYLQKLSVCFLEGMISLSVCRTI